MHSEIVRHEEKLQFLFSQARDMQDLDELDDEAKSGFVSYLCIRTFGYIEYGIKTILREHVRSNALDAPTFNYVNSQLRNLRLRRAQIIELIGFFDQGWSEGLKRRITPDHGDSLKAIVVNRNEIAHGGDVDISLRDLERYFIHAREVVGYVFEVCSM
ncbi:MAG: HEPN domain-containing protein [Chloroflexi bacterium]|nr:HEPN domain-containing protein [Chloroflexota bacterium]